MKRKYYNADALLLTNIIMLLRKEAAAGHLDYTDINEYGQRIATAAGFQKFIPTAVNDAILDRTLKSCKTCCRNGQDYFGRPETLFPIIEYFARVMNTLDSFDGYLMRMTKVEFEARLKKEEKRFNHFVFVYLKGIQLL